MLNVSNYKKNIDHQLIKCLIETNHHIFILLNMHKYFLYLLQLCVVIYGNSYKKIISLRHK